MGRKRKNRIIQDGFDFEVLYNWDCLQRIARRDDYKELCEHLEFGDDGFALKNFPINPATFFDAAWNQLGKTEFEKKENERAGIEKTESERIARQERLLEDISSRFGLTTPVRPDVILHNKYPSSLFSTIPIFERNPFAVSPIFEKTLSRDKCGDIIVSPIHEGRFLILKIDVNAHFKKQIVSGVKELLDNYRDLASNDRSSSLKPCEVIFGDEMTMSFKVDLLADDEDIFEEIRKAIKPSKTRYHLAKRKLYYRVWDERRKGRSFPKIAKDLRIKEDRAKEAFYSAWTLIKEERYDPRSRARNIQVQELSRSCNTCIERGKCAILCPDVLAFVDQDHVKKREDLQARGDLLYGIVTRKDIDSS